jgi:hypothetical protein
MDRGLEFAWMGSSLTIGFCGRPDTVIDFQVMASNITSRLWRVVVPDQQKFDLKYSLMFFLRVKNSNNSETRPQSENFLIGAPQDLLASDQVIHTRVFCIIRS